MNLRDMRSVISLFLLGFVLALSSCGNSGSKVKEEGGQEKDVVTVSLLPQKYFVERIAGDLLEVNVMLPPGASPATYEPKPSQITELTKSSLYFRIGYSGFELAWMEKMEAASPDMVVVDLSEGVELIDNPEHLKQDDGHGHSHGHHHEAEHGHDEEPSFAEAAEEACDHSHAGVDSHIWMSPLNVKIIAQTICDVLSENYPEQKEVFIRNLDDFHAELDSLDAHFKEVREDLEKTAFFIYHPALTYLARDYDLEQYPLELGGKSPSPAHLKQLVDLGKELRIGVVFLQMQFDEHNARVLADELGANVMQINPLDEEWLKQMWEIAGKLEAELGD